MSIHMWRKAPCAEMNLSSKYHNLFPTYYVEVLLAFCHSSNTPLCKVYARLPKSDALDYNVDHLF